MKWDCYFTKNRVNLSGSVVNSKLTWFISYYLIVIVVIWLLICVLYKCAVLFSFFSFFLNLDY